MNADAKETGHIAVIGVGNILMADDGIGIAVIEELKKEPLPDDVAVYDAGTALGDVLSTLGRCERVILIDSCRAGGEPGSIYRHIGGPDDWRSGAIGNSLHDPGVAHAIQLHRLAGGEIGQIVVIGIEPQDISLREGLSPALQQRLPDIVRMVRKELEAPSETRRGGEA